MSNSLADIIARLKQGPATLGWGAILSFGRDELNRMIRNQYLSGFEGFSLLLPFTELFPVNDDKTEQMELRGIPGGGADKWQGCSSLSRIRIVPVAVGPGFAESGGGRWCMLIFWFP